MLDDNDRNAIQGLFQRLRDVESRAEPRDPEAEALIRDEIARQPGAPYYMAQTVLVQEHALSVAERRIQELEAEVQRGSRGDVFGGLFGGRRDVERRPQRYEAQQQQQRGPWDREDQNDRRGGGGFLAGAAQTALGVTGGVLIGSAIGSMFGAGAATAAEPGNDQQADQNADDGGNDAGNDSGSGDDFGGGGDGGGFDFGGDF